MNEEVELFTELDEHQRKEFISSIIDVCLYNKEGFKKVYEVIQEYQNSSKRTPVNMSNFKTDA